MCECVRVCVCVWVCVHVPLHARAFMSNAHIVHVMSGTMPLL